MGAAFRCGRSISEKAQMSDVTSAEVVSFWRGAGPERWFGKDDGFDPTIRTRFLAIHEAGARGELSIMHIARIKAFGEPAVDRSEDRGPPAWVQPERWLGYYANSHSIIRR